MSAMRKTRVPVLVLVALLVVPLAACGGPERPRQPGIEEIRQRARQRPRDPAAQAALAEAELLLEGGDPAAAAAALERARRLRPDDLGLLFLHAVEREAHGHPAEALSAHLELIARAARASDPRAQALAEVAAAEVEGLDDSVEGYASRVAEALAPVHAEPGGLGDAARATVADLLADIAYRRGDVARVAEITAAQRCPTEWRVVGPLGPRALLGFDRELGPDGDARLAERYDHGPSRGTRETRTVRTRGCILHVGGGPVGGAGTSYAETTLSLPRGGRWVLRLETPNAAELFVDGASVARLDRRRETMPRATYHPLELDAGEHVVRVKLVSRHPNPVLALAASQTPGAPGGAPVDGEGLLEDYLRVQRAMARGDVVAARERVRPHLTREGSPLFLIAGAAAALNDPLRSSEVRHDTARRLLGWAAARDAQAWYPRLTLAQLEANEGRDLAAIEALREAIERWPEVVTLPLQLVDLLEQRGWHAQADRAIDRALATVPDACRPRRAALNRARRRHRAAEVEESARALVECDARSDAVLGMHVRRRQWDRALEELARIAALEPEQSPVGELQARLEVARSRGDEAAVRRALGALRERMPRSDSLVLMEADRILAGGDAQAARAHLREALAREPEAMMGLRRVRRAVDGGYALEGYRRDGAEVIAAYEASGRTYREPMVLVFDYTVYRVFEDGSMLELTHNVFRMQSQEAVDRMGEYRVPEGAHMLTLQTVKADGRRLEPDEIAGKETISFPNLAPGDYIEFEYVRPRPAPAGYPGGFVGDRFYFRNYETPFDLSQLTVITPRDVELTLDPRGAAPEAEVRVEGDTRVHRWSVRESRPFEQEPASVPPTEFFPSIDWGHGASWAMYVESLRDVLADRDVRDPAAERLVAEIVGEERSTPEQRAERIYRWVLRNVEDSQDVFGLAPAMLAARTGNRARVLRYLLETAGIEAELALARSFAADRTEAALPNDDTYQNLLVRMRGSDGYRWLHAGARGAPFGYLPPVLAGMDALMLTEGAERVTVGERDLEDDLRTVEVDVELRRDGGARVAVVETFRGAGAVLWRNQLEEIPDADLEDQFEAAYVANLLPGAELARLAVGGREDPEAPLTLRYEVELASLARRANGVWVIPPIYRAQLGPQFAPMASRDITQLVPSGLALDVEVRIEPPPRGGVVSAPADASLESVHGARARIRSAREGDALLIRRSFRIPRMRVSPAQYPDLARFCRAADEAESGEVRVRM